MVGFRVDEKETTQYQLDAAVVQTAFPTSSIVKSLQPRDPKTVKTMFWTRTANFNLG